jgi:siroheme synthase (precorrin-2 oxidase/ferrochelatase)
MNKLVIIGAGQLGTRHLQSIMSLQDDLSIIVVDPSENSLKLAEKNISEICTNNTVQYLSEIPVNEVIFMAIIATNSGVRSTVITDLLENNKVTYVIFEKVLFQTINEYNEIKSLLQKKEVSAWVNCPMRQYPMYKKIKSMIDNNLPTSIDVIGTEWGLACNTVHFLDLCEFLTDSKIIKIDTSALIKKTFESKRAGYIELYGKISVNYNDDSLLSLSCVKGDKFNRSIVIINGNTKIVVDEYLKKVDVFVNDKLVNSFEFKAPYQSELTSLLYNDLVNKKYCDLPSYDTSMEQHITLIKSLCYFLSFLSNKSVNRVKIT